MKRVTEFLQAISYYRSPKIGFLEEVHFETKSGKGRRNSGTNVSCSKIKGRFQRRKDRIFYLLSFGSFSGIKREKFGKLQIHTLPIKSFFIVQKAE